MTYKVKLQHGAVCKFNNLNDPDDPLNGGYCIVTAVNPTPLLIRGEHYRIMHAATGIEGYALAEELEQK